ncbi:DUF1090 domain-containing protein [Enterobacter huaxiensis]|uniref:DUF1090 domain-containing protein n=1 Tax=Enterobacter huaxiensis TaxID=2494702 RepID=A0A428LGQ4_9ENTR|nr:DUF1090 domain-containing protein [Enterobacter huaxiensis]RSK63156.1 DUF1090 domain-containing protein [Enterobacter huaxiensis]
MNKSTYVLAGIVALVPFFSARAATGCEAKRQEIKQQINLAQSYGNEHRVVGLQKALSELNANCTDDRLRLEREADVRKKEQKVEERRQELAEAKADGREDKIRKKQEKLEEAQDELTEAKNILNK